MEKFSFDSDYVDSFLDSVLLSKFPYSISKHGEIYAKCVNMYSPALKIADCEKAKSIVEEFNKNEEYIEKKNKVKENCQDELYKAHSNFYTWVNNKYSIYSIKLNNCINRNTNI
jgi:hypothetical protein